MTGTPPLDTQQKIDNGVDVIFNPGYYLNNYSTYDRNTKEHTLSQPTVDEVNNNASVKGLFLKVSWISLEKNNTYLGSNFSWEFVDAAFAAVAPKQVIIYLETKNFGAPHRYLHPYYMANDSSFGGGPNSNGAGVYGAHTKSNNSSNYPCFHNAKVAAAIENLFDGIAARYANNPQFEGIVLWETARATPDTNYSDWGSADKDAYRQHTHDVAKYLAALLPRQQVWQQINWSGDYGLNRDAMIDDLQSWSRSQTDYAVSIGQVDGGVELDLPGRLPEVHDRIRDGSDEFPNFFKNENPVSIDADAADGYTITESMQYYRDRIKPWYEFRLHANASAAERAETVAFINSTGGTIRSNAYYDGYTPPPDPSPGPTPSEISGVSAATETGWGTVTVATPVGTVEGQLMVAVAAINSNVTGTASAPAGWDTQVQYWDTVTDRVVGVFTKVAGASEAENHAFTFSVSASYSSALIRTYSGTHDSVIDVASVTGNSVETHNHQTPAITTVTDKSFVLSIVAANSNAAAAVAPPASYTLGATAIRSGAGTSLAEKEVTPPGLETPGAWDIDDDYGAPDAVVITMALKPAAAGAVLPIAWDTIPNQETHPGAQGYTFHTAPYITAGTGDGTAITYSLTSTPTGFAIDSATGIITVDGAASGNYPLELTATDDSDAASTTFTITLTVDAVDMVLVEGTVTPSTTELSIGVGAGMAYGTFWCSISETVAYDANSAARIVDEGHPDNDQTKSLTGDTQLPIFTFTGLTPGQQYYYGVVQEASD